jgi:hypothetical protein
MLAKDRDDKKSTGSIFRPAAIQHYMQSREEPVFPRLVSPRVFAYLWVLLALLVTGGLVAWFARVPTYASGPAAVVSLSRVVEDVQSQDDVILVAFLPPENISHLRIGQTLWVQIDPAGKRLGVPIIAVEPEISSPDAIRRRFALEGGVALVVTQPAAVAIAHLGQLATGLPVRAYEGSVYRVNAEIGSQRVISLLPLIGPLFDE